MKNTHHPFKLACVALAALLAAGCNDDGDTPPVAGAQTVDVTTTVLDGALENALVCVDKNANDRCDADELQGYTKADGKVTLAVPSDDLGKYPMVAMAIASKTVDGSYGPVTADYTMSTPPARSGVISPLTTLAHDLVRDTGVTSGEADLAMQGSIGTSASVYTDYAADKSGGVDLAALARMVLVTRAQQTAAVAGTVGSDAADGHAITAADVALATRQQLVAMLPDMTAAIGAAAIADEKADAARATAIDHAAEAVVAASELKAASVGGIVAANRAAPDPASTAAPGPSLSLASLTFTDAANYFVRYLSGSTAQNTPDAKGMAHFVDRRFRAARGNVAAWGTGADPRRQADLQWTGSAWTACPINHENATTPRDAQGNSRYEYCAGETGTSARRVVDLKDQSMASVYAAFRAAGYTNLFIATPSVLGDAKFPDGSKLYYQRNMQLTMPTAYDPGTGNVVLQYGDAIAAGGTASEIPAGTGCNAPEAATAGSQSTTLEALIKVNHGTPCKFNPGTLTLNGVTLSSDATNVWWGNSTVSLGKIGSAPLSPAAPTSYYSGNTILRAAFGTGTDQTVTYYACKERLVNGSPRNCNAIGTGTYKIQKLEDGKSQTLTFDNAPAMVSALTYARVFVERGGHVYYGYRARPIATSSVRLNTTGVKALMQQLGVTPPDPEQALALTAGSYQGTWDFRDAAATTGGTTLVIGGDGSVSCTDRATSTAEACTLQIANPATGAFTTTGGGGSSASGSFDFLAGTAAGTYHDPTSTPADGSFVGTRR